MPKFKATIEGDAEDRDAAFDALRQIARAGRGYAVDFVGEPEQGRLLRFTSTPGDTPRGSRLEAVEAQQQAEHAIERYLAEPD